MNRFKIVFFDCDGVLLFGFPLTRLEQKLDIGLEITQKMEKYYNGEVAFQDFVDNIEFLYKKAKLTKDLYEEIVNFKNYQINKEAKILIDYLQKNEYEIAIISSGSAEYVSGVAEYFGIKYFRVNSILDFNKDGKFEKLRGFGEDAQVKVDQVKEICGLLKINPDESVFIGDSDNDIKAFEFTKHGILYGSKRLDLEKHAWKRVEDLRDIKKILEDANLI